jgi:hypothetical protein
VSLTLSDPDVEELRSMLEEAARLEGLDGVHTPLASRAMEFLPRLSARVRALEVRRAEGIATRGESKTAREKRVRAECMARDQGCSAVGFLGIACFGRLEWQHVHGRGEGKPPESVENTEMLCALHHQHAQEHNPSRAVWLTRHLERSWRFGHEEEAAFTDRLLALERAQHPAPTTTEEERTP